MKKYLPWIITTISVVITSITIVLSVQTFQTNKTANTLPIPPFPNISFKERYPLLSERINRNADSDKLTNFIPLRQDLINYIATYSGTMSMYFEYIPTGISIGINEKDPFMYASLLKVPMAMAIYHKKSEGQVNFQSITSIKAANIDKQSGDVWKKGVGAQMTVQEAIHEMLVNSDNTAYEMIGDLVTESDLLHVFNFVDIPFDDSNNNSSLNPTVTAKNYTSVLKSLYFSSFLNPSDSQEILTLLSQSTLDLGLRADIPIEVPIAHKWGINQVAGVFSDCGIIYFPNDPYFLCIMQKSAPQSTDITAFRTISDKIYQYILTQQ